MANFWVKESCVQKFIANSHKLRIDSGFLLSPLHTFTSTSKSDGWRSPINKAPISGKCPIKTCLYLTGNGVYHHNPYITHTYQDWCISNPHIHPMWRLEKISSMCFHSTSPHQSHHSQIPNTTQCPQQQQSNHKTDSIPKSVPWIRWCARKPGEEATSFRQVGLGLVYRWAQGHRHSSIQPNHLQQKLECVTSVVCDACGNLSERRDSSEKNWLE